MTTLKRFSPPGNLKDLNEENLQIWSDKNIGKWTDDEIAGRVPGPCNTDRTPLSQYFNPTITPFNQGQKPVTVTWNAFPNQVKLRYPNDQKLAWRMADATRLVQDEYLEWSSARNSDGKLTKCTFTCEGPEYWQFIADWQNSGQDGKTVFDLYKELNPDYAGQMSEGDLFLVDQKTGNAVYNPWNYWNMSTESGSIAHLIHPANSLSAEIDLAAQATVMRMNAQQQPIVDSKPLIECSKYGQPLRNSDPAIGFAVNSTCREKNALTIADPVALYINKFDLDSFTLKLSDTNFVPLSDPSLKGVVTFPRGDLPHGLRMVIQIPPNIKSDAGKPLTVSDIYDSDENPIQFASQFALGVTMGVSVVTLGDFAVSDNERCPCDKPTVPVIPAPPGDLPGTLNLPRPHTQTHIPTALLPIGVGYGKRPREGASGLTTR